MIGQPLCSSWSTFSRVPITQKSCDFHFFHLYIEWTNDSLNNELLSLFVYNSWDLTRISQHGFFACVWKKKKRFLHIYRVVGSGFCVFKTVCLNQMLLQPSSLYLLRLESTVLISILLRICECVHARVRVGVHACECCVCVKQKIIVSFDLWLSG